MRETSNAASQPSSQPLYVSFVVRTSCCAFRSRFASSDKFILSGRGSFDGSDSSETMATLDCNLAPPSHPRPSLWGLWGLCGLWLSRARACGNLHENGGSDEMMEPIGSRASVIPSRENNFFHTSFGCCSLKRKNGKMASRNSTESTAHGNFFLRFTLKALSTRVGGKPHRRLELSYRH